MPFREHSKICKTTISGFWTGSTLQPLSLVVIVIAEALVAIPGQLVNWTQFKKKTKREAFTKGTFSLDQLSDVG